MCLYLNASKWMSDLFYDVAPHLSHVFNFFHHESKTDENYARFDSVCSKKSSHFGSNLLNRRNWTKKVLRKIRFSHNRRPTFIGVISPLYIGLLTLYN